MRRGTGGGGRASEFISRGRFLKLSGAGVAGMALLGSTGAGTALAQPSGTSMLEREFDAAAKKYKVPREVLLAMAVTNSALEMPPPKTSDYKASNRGEGNPEARGAYGIMQLVKNPSSDTLGEAAKLTGISEEKLKIDRASNIMGGAALLASAQGKKPAKLKDWLGGVHGKKGNGKSYEAVAGVGGGDLYVDQVSKKLENGAQIKTTKNERVSLPGQDLEAHVNERGEVG